MIGLRKMTGLRKRCAQLRDLITMADSIARQIRYTDQTKEELLRTAQSTRRNALPFCESGDRFFRDPAGTLCELQPQLYLNDEEFCALQDFFLLLGTTGREDQLLRCERIQRQFTECLSREEKDLPQRMRLIATLSLCGGMALILLLM